MATYVAYPHTTSVPVLVRVASSRILVRVVVLFLVGLSFSIICVLIEIWLSSVGPLQYVRYNVFAFLRS